MFENNNLSIIKEIAGEQYKNHRLRNIISIFAICLTTILITAMLTAGISFISTSENAMEQTPGPEAHGIIIGNRSHYDNIIQENEVEWADYVEQCSTAPLHNNEFGGIETQLYAPDMSFYRHNHVELIEGTYPQSTSEILISDSMLHNIQMESPVGKEFPLEVVILQNGENVEQKINMRICGIYKNPLSLISSIYDEIYTAPGFAKEYNKEMNQKEHIIYVKLNNLNPLLLKTDIEEKLDSLHDKAGGFYASAGKYGTALLSSSFIMLLPVLFFVALLMGSGYFLIYNIFHISISSDVRWFGMMKTIGTTKKQLKDILSIQIRRMSILGIGAGVILGYVIGCLIAPRVLGLTDWSLYYKAPAFLPIALVAILFSWITVKISARKPLKTASSISPVSAARYVPVKKKNIFTVISLALSGSIFLIVMNVVIGFQEDIYVNRYNQNDFQIMHKASLWLQSEPYQPISEDLVRKISELSFVEKEDIIYMARSNDEEKNERFYLESKGEIKPEGKLYNFYEKLLGEYLPMSLRGNMSIGIFGIPKNRWETELANYNIISGEIDEEKFASGDYIVYRKENFENLARTYGITSQADKEDMIQTGDRLNVSFYDKERDCYIQKELTVMAVIERANQYTSSDISSSILIMPDTLFKEIYSGYSHMIGSIQITAKDDLSKDQFNQIMNAVKEEHSTQLMTTSKYQKSLDAENTKNTYTYIGIFLVTILSIVGISNVVNTVSADIFAHRIEYAAMQSIGMTKKQLFRLLLKEGGKFCIWAVILVIPLGSAGAYMIAGSPLFTGFNVFLFVESILIIVIVMLLICAALAKILTQVLNKKSIVERLREIE